MSNAEGRFAIDPSTGVVTVADGSLLDFESATAHTIAVLASKEGFALVGIYRINVTDVPAAPVDTDAAADQVSEGAAAGTAVGITASSVGESGSTVAYSLADNAGGRFAINASTGVVTVSNGVLLDGPETHYVRVVANHSGEGSYAQTFAVSVLNANPTATITSLNGGASEVGFLGVPVSFGGSFSDTAALDTHTASLDWGDGSAVATFGGGNVTSPLTATHTYQAAGSYTVSFKVQDDDGGTHTVTSTINMHDGVGGVAAVGATLEGLLESETDPQVLQALAQALDELEGNNGGASANGAVDGLAAGDLVAALGKIEDAVALLNEADAAGGDTADLRLMLALAARITAEKAQADAIAAIGPSPSRGQDKQLSSLAASVVAGRAAIGSGDYGAAIQDFTSAVQRALALIR
ncbi:MAG: PKD domain-containing protein [Dehalococcoidia bacterium]|nr:PKD domain-containing protein [Dehalococcoidia bacterium]